MSYELTAVHRQDHDALLGRHPADRERCSRIAGNVSCSKSIATAIRLHERSGPAEAVAGAFDYNHVPYLRSFVEVRSANQVRFIVHGANGPLRWGEMETCGAVLPAGKTGDDIVEFIVPMPAASAP